MKWLKYIFNFFLLAAIVAVFNNCGSFSPTSLAVSSSSNGIEYPPSEPNISYTPTHYVSSAASGSGDGSLANPWTLAQAMANAVAGNAVQIAPGIYQAPSTGDGLSPAFAPAHDGTLAQPIVFYAQYPAATEANPANWSRLRRVGPADSPVIGAGGVGAYRSHIIYDGFYFNYNENAMPSARGIVYFGFNNTGNKLRRSRFDRANLGGADDGDNFNCVQIHSSDNAEITDNLFNGGYDPNGSHNESVITTYGARDFVIENNTFQNVTTGIYVKGSFGGVGNYGRVRFNKFTGFRSGVELTENENGFIVDVSHNLFYDWGQVGSRAAIIYENSVASEHRNFVVHHNTIIVPSTGNDMGGVGLEAAIDMTNNTFRDNIVAAITPGNTQVLVNGIEVPSLNNFNQWNNNLYYNNGAGVSFALNGAVQNSFAAWQAASGRDGNSLIAEPQFVNAAANDFRLISNGQPALSASSTSSAVGCYVTGNEAIGHR